MTTDIRRAPAVRGGWDGHRPVTIGDGRAATTCPPAGLRARPAVPPAVRVGNRTRGPEARGGSSHRPPAAGPTASTEPSRRGRPHPASAEPAAHVPDITLTPMDAADQGRALPVTSTCERPAPLH
ncbi:hypothetical protein [Streptomyces sp. NPDC008092]|uniref:hypothetical protein n=1 Tax=Streptomyces sp. NPDC008092 TaxID=3364808 RepID=UPI0036E10228